jgi:ubiquinone/menaquinone biosynthesis C-methylase UbiE
MQHGIGQYMRGSLEPTRSFSEEERAQKKRFGEFYERSLTPVMRSIGNHVCGCDYVGNSWTTHAEADEVIERLELRSGLRLLDLGAGSGWPGLYTAQKTGCDVVLIDLPEIGLRIAMDRADTDGIKNHVTATAADASDLPFPDQSFEAISHSDLLCCLLRKRDVLESCRRVVRPGGRMVFTVISVAPGLSAAERRRGLENGPEFIESEADYSTLLAQTGWTAEACEDVTSAFERSYRRQIVADEQNQDDLCELIGSDDLATRMQAWRSKLFAISDGLLRRELFVVVPAPT